MQPNNTQKPVIDIMPPAKPETSPTDTITAGAPVAVRKAPEEPHDTFTAGAAATDSPSAPAHNHAAPGHSKPLPKEQHLKPGPTAPDGNASVPVGAIVTAILAMLVLSGLAILVYIKS